MNKKQNEDFILQMIIIKNYYDDVNTFIEILGFDNKVIDLYFSIIENNIKLIEKIFNDKYGWISWFIFENDWGKNEYEAGYEDNIKKIKTLDDLYNLIVEKNND